MALVVTAGLLFAGTAAQAKPATTTTVAVDLSVTAPGLVQTGAVEVVEGADGTTTLIIDVTRTRDCAGGVPGTTVERWQGTTTVASLTVPNNLSSASAVGTLTAGYVWSSTCEGPAYLEGPVGDVIVEGLATDRTVRDRTSAGTRILTRSADFTVTFGTGAATSTGIIERLIG